MKLVFTFLALTIGVFTNAQISDNSSGTTATGNGSVAMGTTTTASGSYSTAMGVFTTASGDFSVAMSYQSIAAGLASTAIGWGTMANATASTALGYSTITNGEYSTAMGWNTSADGKLSTAIGYETTASDYGSLVIGRYNLAGATVTNSATEFNTANTAFVIGNGTVGADMMDPPILSDAFKVMFNGDAYVSNSLYLGGTAITSTAAELNLLAGVTVIGTGILSNVTEGSNTGARLSTSNAANHGDIGSNAVDLSYSNSSSTTRGATGSNSTAMGDGTTASGPFSTAMGTASIASGEKSIAIGNQYQTNATTPEYNNEAAGSRSFVIGNNNSTTGAKAFSIGTDNLSTGVSSIALGENNIASGNFSQAIGLFSESTAYSSFAIGNNAFADGYNTTAIGTANTADVNADPLNWSLNNRAFVIGNGYYDVASATLNRSDALTVLFDGTTTISGSVIAPAFIGDGSQLTNLPTINSPLSLNDTSGTGMQSPTSTASGIWSTAIGYSAEASNQVAVAFGDNTTASGSRSTAMGINTLASGEYATSLNGDTIASGDYSLATGASSIASGGASTALGNYTTASGDFSTTMGNSTIASDYASTVIGQYNLVGSTVTDSEGTFNTDSPVFVIGNGTFNNRSDAVTVLFDGTTTIAGDLSINSDARLKANIISLGSTLSKLLQIDGKTYTMKRDKNQKQKIGVLAQDIEKVFPELVSESKGIKSVNYQGLVPVLINSIKEQEEKIKRLEMLVEKLLEVKK